jgi:APA family basic amino acid/polyamine antiporter
LFWFDLICLRTFTQTYIIDEFKREAIRRDVRTGPTDIKMMKRRFRSVWNAVWDKKTPDMILAELKFEQNHNCESGGGGELKKCLNKFSLVTFGLGSTIGVGVFVLTGQAIELFAGPAAVFSFVFAGIACIFSAFAYAEFAARIPVAGSAYTFAYTSIGELIAWIVGWNLTLEYAISAAAISRGWAGYLVQFFNLVGLDVPSKLYSWDLGWISASPVAVLLIFVCTIVIVYGVQESATMNNIITSLNVITIVFFIVFGLFHLKLELLSPFAPFGVSGILKGASFLFFSLIGFDAVSSLAEECQNPQSDMPFGIIVTLLVSVLLYSSTTLVLAGIANPMALRSTAPLSAAFEQLGINWAGVVIAICAVTTTTATTLCSMIGQPRIFYRMSKDGLLWERFSKISAKFQTPLHSCIFTGILSGILAFCLDLATLSDMVSIGTLISFTIVCIAVIPLRFQKATHSHMKSKGNRGAILLLLLSIAFGVGVRLSYWILCISSFCLIVLTCIYLYTIMPTESENSLNRSSFLCPAVPFIPAAGIICNCVMLSQLEIFAWARFGAWSLVGFSIYAIYGYSHSKLRKTARSSSAERIFFLRRSSSSEPEVPIARTYSKG